MHARPDQGLLPGAYPAAPNRTKMNASLHIAGCARLSGPDAAVMNDCTDWLRRYGARVLSLDDGKAVFVQFDAGSAQLVLFGCRTALSRRPPVLRFGFASVVKESGADGQPRAGERGILQASDLAAAARAGQVLLSSQLGSLLQLAELEPWKRLRPMRVQLADGRSASAYEVEPLRAAHTAEPASS
jgi:hypothetical protein